MKRIVAGLILSIGVASTASAGSYCYNETVTTVIMQGDQIFFTSNPSCPNWCEVNGSWSAAAQARAFAMLTTAKVAGMPLSFYWTDQSGSCSSIEPAYSMPVYLIM
jgi:hypothetical protein